MTKTLVDISEYGLMGKSFYWHRYADYGFSLDDLKATGVGGSGYHPSLAGRGCGTEKKGLENLSKGGLSLS